MCPAVSYTPDHPSMSSLPIMLVQLLQDIVLFCLPDLSALSFVMAGYSYAPLILFLALSWKIFVHQKVPVVLLFLTAALCFNELFLKQVIRQTRPDGSCATSYGMPSGHSVVALSYLGLLIHKTVFHTETSHLSRVIACGQHISLWVPVPVSRIYLKYHTFEQVLVGGLVGLGLSLVFLALAARRRIRHLPVVDCYISLACLNTFPQQLLAILRPHSLSWHRVSPIPHPAQQV